MRLDAPHVLRGVASPHVWTRIRVIRGVITTSVTAGGRRLGIDITGIRFRAREIHCSITLTLIIKFVAGIVSL
jgi:hypothetical protein